MVKVKIMIYWVTEVTVVHLSLLLTRPCSCARFSGKILIQLMSVDRFFNSHKNRLILC